MSIEDVAPGAVGLPHGGSEEGEGGPAAIAAAAAEPLALADGWEDWPEEVWAEFRRGTEPLTWNRAQRIAGRVCREGSLRYGRESSERFRKFESVMLDGFGPGWRIRARKAEAEAAKPETTDVRKAKLREEISSAKRNISDLKSASFLVSKVDPSVVLPGFMMGKGGPKVGDYVVVVHEDKMYPAILGDAGPSYKVGEASLRLCNEINHTGTPMSRPVSDLAVTYLVFPGSADEKRSQPDLDRWHVRCTELLAEIGVTNNTALHRWENIVPPWPTPTPTPAPAPSPSADPSGTPVVDFGSASGPVADTSGAPVAAQTNAPSTVQTNAAPMSSP